MPSARPSSATLNSSKKQPSTSPGLQKTVTLPHPDFCTAMREILDDGSLPVEVKQAALIQLKKTIKLHWLAKRESWRSVRRSRFGVAGGDRRALISKLKTDKILQRDIVHHYGLQLPSVAARRADRQSIPTRYGCIPRSCWPLQPASSSALWCRSGLSYSR